MDLLVTDLQSIRTRAGSPARQTVTAMIEEVKKFRKMRFLRRTVGGPTCRDLDATLREFE